MKPTHLIILSLLIIGCKDKTKELTVVKPKSAIDTNLIYHKNWIDLIDSLHFNPIINHSEI